MMCDTSNSLHTNVVDENQLKLMLFSKELIGIIALK